MASQEHLDILKQGVEVWNRWRQENPVVRPNLFHVKLSGADLSNANLSGAHFSRANLGNANLSGADLSRAKLNDADLFHANVSNANLSGADLRTAYLRGAGLFQADLHNTDLSGAVLRSANLFQADLRNTDLRNTDLSGAILRSADLSGSDLRGANLNGANLLDANVAKVRIIQTVFVDNDLTVARNLEAVHHEGPSYISIDTLVKSKGQIPEAFLRGCGLSDWEIESAKLYNPDLSNEEINDIQYRIHDLRVRQAIQISPLFISYSHADGEFVDEVEKNLTKQGVRYWRDIHHATAGRLERQVDRAISINDTVLIVLSADSVNSDWVEYEVDKAREKEKKTGRDTLCPVALDDSWKACRWSGPLRKQVEKYHILNFSNWRDDAHFQRMFGKLLEGLNLFYK